MILSPLKFIQATPHPHKRYQGAAIAVLAGLSLLGIAPTATAAEKVVLTYGPLGRSITVAELKTFAQTGQQTPTLKFLLRASKQDPKQVQRVLTHAVKVSPTLLDDGLHSFPGEYSLFMAGKIFHTPQHRSSDKALRSAIILATADDRQLSILEFLERYPTRELYVDGDRLVKTSKDLSQLVGTVRSELKGPIAIMTALFNGIICKCESPPGPDNPINAN